jgi:hypothetical protein
VLRAELTKVVIDMEVGPPEPRGLGQPAEYRMRLPVDTPRLRGDELQ